MLQWRAGYLDAQVADRKIEPFNFKPQNQPQKNHESERR
jgi:hypothetical protein